MLQLSRNFSKFFTCYFDQNTLLLVVQQMSNIVRLFIFSYSFIGKKQNCISNAYYSKIIPI